MVMRVLLAPGSLGISGRLFRRKASPGIRWGLGRAPVRPGTVTPHWRQPVLYRLFERLLHPYPPAEPALPPPGFFAFLWACTDGLRGKIAAMAALTALMSDFEALLFAMLV